MESIALYPPESPFLRERGACGIGAIVNLNCEATRQVVDATMEGLCDLDLRGAGVEDTYDGAGAMFRTLGMHRFFERFLPQGVNSNGEEIYAGNFFIAPDEGANLRLLLETVSGILASEGIRTVQWRTSVHHTSSQDIFEIDDSALGARARETMPIFAQILFTQGTNDKDSLPLALHRAKLQIAMQTQSVHAKSLEMGTATYAAMSSGAQFRKPFYKDVADPLFKSDAGAWHVRFATNTRSRWPLAQPMRRMGHNGEINTIGALRNAADDLVRSLSMVNTVLGREMSDSGDIDRIISLFYKHGVPLPECFMRLFSYAPDDLKLMPERLQRYYSAVRKALGPLSAAEGPAGIVGMDGEYVIGKLDGLGLRPLRAIETESGLFVLTSEIGAPSIPLRDIKRTFQLDAGEMVFVKKNGESSKIYYPGEAEMYMAENTRLNVDELHNGKIIVLPGTRKSKEIMPQEKVIERWNLFGGNSLLLDRVRWMAGKGAEPVLGMGNDKPLAVFSKGSHRLAQFFHQIVAVVTNPPMDFKREGESMDLATYIGRRPIAHEHAHKYTPQPHIELKAPVLSEEQYLNLLESDLHVYRIDTHFSGKNAGDMIRHIQALKAAAVKIARAKEHPVICFSDRGWREGELYIPPGLILGAVHNELQKLGLRRNVSLVCDTGEAFEAHDLAFLVTMGADAVNPYLMWQAAESGLLSDGQRDPDAQHDPEKLKKNLMENYVSMFRRIMSKMGITSIEGYRDSKAMEAVGIDTLIIQSFLKCPVANIGGITMEDIVESIFERSKEKKTVRENHDKGHYSPAVRKAMEDIVHSGRKYETPGEAYEVFKAEVKKLQEENPVFLRDLLDFIFPEEGIVLDDVMSVSGLLKNHIRGAHMSQGALQPVAHRSIARAFNELGGMSGSGEGGEDVLRNPGKIYEKDRSRNRQVASGRFGVNAEYLVFADEIEIKIGQGAKPGEGGHLPGFKVGPVIAKLRNTQVGVDIISPPPQHDLYSIEDLGRLIQDLRAINPEARVGVKITTNAGTGVVAVGVAKAGADFISLSGWEGGTGAAVSSAIEHTGVPLELGLADAHQALAASGLRDLVKLRVDGGIKTGEDIVKLACLGADEFALATAPVVAGLRCIFCHSCSGQAKGAQRGTFEFCPTDITTPGFTGGLGLGAKRKRGDEITAGKAYETCWHATKHYLELLGEDVRGILAKLGKRNLSEIVGDTALLHQVSRTKESDRVRLDALLRDVRSEIKDAIRKAAESKVSRALNRPAVNEANQYLIDETKRQVAEGRERVEIKYTLRPKDRSFGATLAGKIARGEIKVPKGGIHIRTAEFAGQSFGVWNVAGVFHEHIGLSESDGDGGFANDFAGMGMGGGRVVLKQPAAIYRPDNSVGGNACAYGATGGEFFANGKVGQRFGVRNSGATLVAEDTGKYPFEYMTDGFGVTLRRAGNQIGTGMTGGALALFNDPFWEDGKALQRRLHPDVMITRWSERDKLRLKKTLQTHFDATGSPLAKKYLDNFHFYSAFFERVVPRDHYVNAVASVFSYEFYRLPDADSLKDVARNAAVELMVFLGFDENNAPLQKYFIERILRVKQEIEAKVLQSEVVKDFEDDMRSKLKLKETEPLPVTIEISTLPEELRPDCFQIAKAFAREFIAEESGRVRKIS